MGVNFFRKTAASAPGTKASATGPILAQASAGRIAWSPRDSASLTRTGFAGNPIGFRAVKLVAEAAAALPLVLQDARQRYESHPLLALLSRPNPGQGQAELLEALYGQLLLAGDGYLEVVSTATGRPLELHVLRSDRMRLVPGPDGWPEAYDYTVGGRTHRFPAEAPAGAICHLKCFHPLDDHYGLSPLQPAAQALDVHNAASRWSKGLLDNAARPSGAIVYTGGEGPGTLSPEQYDRLVGEMEAYHMGARNAGRPMLLEGGLDWKPMGFSPSDMEFHKSKEAAAREIAVAFGVPPMLLGIPGEATYANYQEAHRAFYRLTVLPLATRVGARLGAWLSAHLGADLSLKPDLDQVPALAAERDQQWARIAGADFLSAGEKRRLLGLPPLAEGEGEAQP
ncbi:phage portal protein [Roseivivax sp. GX 12232]|uniref:phage portal protein n=1 Tax=Roseivivax sp. GX 12232 TaxID=2900547 RepID=UPI001E49A0B9|nr:phage portal protein [Roseivivax sp. GX 12232]MCE0504374.1 phage portal protein [Roseivivax sp. GX 12232]